MCVFFFFKQKTAYEMRISDWSSDVCSSDLLEETRRVENSGGIQESLAGRYALALFELARDGKQIDSVAQSLASVKAALAQSEEFRALTTSPLVGRTAAAATIKAVSESLGLDPLTQGFLGVQAENRRRAQLGEIGRAHV